MEDKQPQAPPIAKSRSLSRSRIPGATREKLKKTATKKNNQLNLSRAVEALQFAERVLLNKEASLSGSEKRMVRDLVLVRRQYNAAYQVARGMES